MLQTKGFKLHNKAFPRSLTNKNNCKERKILAIFLKSSKILYVLITFFFHLGFEKYIVMHNTGHLELIITWPKAI